MTDEPDRPHDGGDAAPEPPTSGAERPRPAPSPDGQPKPPGDAKAKSDDEDKAGDQDGDGEAQGKKDDADQKAEQPRPARWPWFVAAALFVIFVAVVLFIVYSPHADVRTDDAYVTARYTIVSPRVAGQIATVDVDDNQPVRRGQLLVTIDDRDLRAARDQAAAALRADRARVAQADAAIQRQPALVRQAEATVLSADARLGLARADAARYANLATTGAGTFQQHQQADAQLAEAEASVIQARADVTATRRQTDALVADRAAALGRVAQDAAALRQADLNLGYTRIVAPIDGTVGQRTVQVGNNVAPGSGMMALVPLNDIYVTADYREIDLRHVRPGQHARIHVDAYDVVIDGIVQGVAPNSGASLSPIPPNNATGNFTKIVQRLPVKIVFVANQPLVRLLRVGMSVEVTVHTGLEDVVTEQSRTTDRVTAPAVMR